MDFKFVVALLFVGCVAGVSIRGASPDTSNLPTDLTTMDLRMRGAHPTQPDQYFCTGYKLDMDDQYIVKFEALADAGTAHHILMFGCKYPARAQQNYTWTCGRACRGEEQILFAWAKNAPPLQLPKDVGRHIGHSASIDYIVLQVHYARTFTAEDKPDYSGIRIYLTQERQKYVAGIYLLLAYDTLIPANTEKVHADISCRFDWEASIFPFGFRTHAHSLGRVISGYRYRNNSFEQIGKGNPLWPQAFYPVGKTVEIKPGDVLAAQCTYSSLGRNRITRIGATHKDEMCNFYIMYYMDAAMENQRGQDTCAGNKVPSVTHILPEDSDTPLPPNPVLEEDAKGHSHKVHMQEEGENPEISAEKLHPKMNLKFVSSVPKSGSVVFGQVGGVATNEEGDVYIFHRGSIVWNSLSFNLTNHYQLQNLPVNTDPIVIIDKNDHVKKSFGKNMFYLPHGLTVDKQGNIWVTDVGLHQVFRFPPGSDTPDMTLGERFIPGTDQKHFCKPTDVAVMSNGDFFVSDGYCNARVMKFDKNGYFLKQWGMTNGAKGDDGYPYAGAFNVPHSITLAEDRGLVCVADRENGRIQCFDLEGDFIRQMHPPSFGAYLYAVEYCPLHGGVLFAVNGPDYSRMDVNVQGFTLDIDTGKLKAQWNIPKKGLSHPHDITVHSPSHTVYVGELNPEKVWKFEMAEIGDNNQLTATTVPSKTLDIVDISDTNLPPLPGHGYKEPSPDWIPLAGAVQFPDEATETVISESTKAEEHVVQNLTSSFTETPSAIDSTGKEILVDLQRLKKIKEPPKDSFAPAMIIGTLLVVPVILLVIITIFVRLYQTEKKRLDVSSESSARQRIHMKNQAFFSSKEERHLGECSKSRNKKKIKFNLGNILNSHKGFDRLSTEDDDHDIDVALEDSDQEEFSVAKNSKA